MPFPFGSIPPFSTPFEIGWSRLLFKCHLILLPRFFPKLPDAKLDTNVRLALVCTESSSNVTNKSWEGISLVPSRKA